MALSQVKLSAAARRVGSKSDDIDFEFEADRAAEPETIADTDIVCVIKDA